MGITMDTLECNLIYTSLSIFFLLVPSTKYLEPFNIVGHIACSVLLVYICSQMATSDTQIDRMSLIHCEWSSVFRFFGILLFSFVPVVQVGDTYDRNEFFPVKEPKLSGRFHFSTLISLLPRPNEQSSVLL